MHEIHYASYKENVNRRKVEDEWDEICEREIDSGGGLYNHIRWIENGISDSYDEAQKRIENLDRGDYDQLAVKYKRFHENKTKGHQELIKKVNEAYEDFRKKSERLHYTPGNVTSSFVGCKNCGSKISVKHLKSNSCPVCHADLRPASTLKTIENAEKKWHMMAERLKKDTSKGKFDVLWLVKVEYHV